MIRTLSTFVAVALAPTVSASFLMVPDSSGDRVVLLDASDGSVIDPLFIDIGPAAKAAGVSSTPIEALQVGEEIWISDQIADRIWRFSAEGALLGDIGAGQVDNIRGMEVVGDTVYVAQAATSAFDEGILTIDVPTLTITGSFAEFSSGLINYWDVRLYNGELLVTNSVSGGDAIERYAPDGTFLGFFAQSDGTTSFDFLQQVTARGSNGNLLGGGFSTPSGAYEFLPNGTSLGIVAATDFGPRGVAELADGSVLWTNGTWIRTDEGVILDGGSYRFITVFDPPCPADLDGSGDVGFGDILAIIGAWGPCGVPCPEDLSGNGQVDFADILVVIAEFGPC
ncbi:MAG: NHL repeat-containing protein [Planctomycetota bacterium]|jgi:hypothetical protein